MTPRYVIMSTDAGCRLYDSLIGGQALMTGTESECRDLITALETPVPLVEFKEPVANPGPAGRLIRAGRRVGNSVLRLEMLLEKQVPPEVVRLELAILSKWAGRLSEEVASAKPETLCS